MWRCTLRVVALFVHPYPLYLDDQSQKGTAAAAHFLEAGEDEIEFTWVKGHAGDEYNDIADRLAVEASHTGVGRTGVGTPERVASEP